MRTGDLARIDHSGLLFIEGRLKDLIIVAGRNIYPQVRNIYVPPGTLDCMELYGMEQPFLSSPLKGGGHRNRTVVC